jgi:CRP-like cAMP-binding protein
MARTSKARRRPAADLPLAAESSLSLSAVPFGPCTGSGPVRLLSRRHQHQLAAIASRVRLPRRKVIYREGAEAGWVFLIGEGVVKAYREFSDGTRRVASFLFAEDIFGLSERGRYVNSVQSVTAVTLYRIRFDVLVNALRADAELDFQFLCKAAHELRESQHHVMMVSRRDAIGKVAMLLRMLEVEVPPPEGEAIAIPMTRSDIANYLGLSLEAVSRACRRLEREGIIDFTGRDRATVLDRGRFDELLAR